jgi:hypothetical protein
MQQSLLLVPVEKANSKAYKSGDWSDPSVWDNPDTPDVEPLPTANDFVWIPAETCIVQDVDTPRLLKLLVDGCLSPKDEATVTLSCETVIFGMMSRWWAGQPDKPFTGQWNIRFADNGPVVYTVDDPYLTRRGIHAMGEIALYGNPEEPYCFTTGNKVGDITITLKSPAIGWKTGDALLSPGVGYAPTPVQIDDDLSRIASISDDLLTVTLAVPLKFDHGVTDREGFSRPMFVANISPRTIHLQSDSTVTPNRAHNQFMRGDLTTKHVLHYVSVYDCGRTNKIAAITDPDGKGGGTANPRARYPLHFHRCGASIKSVMADVFGCCVVGSPDWAFTNHDSYVGFNKCVSYDILGSHYVGEVGPETGFFKDCVAMRCKQNTDGVPAGIGIGGTDANWGRRGHGFFTMCGGIQFQGTNIATGCSSWAFVQMGIVFGLPGTPNLSFNVTNLPPPYTYPGHTYCMPAFVPQNISNAHCFGSYGGLLPWASSSGNGIPTPAIGRNVISDCKFEVEGGIMHLGYTSNSDVSRVVGVKITPSYTSSGFQHSGACTDTSHTDCAAYGFSVGKLAGTRFHQDITRFTGRNLCDIFVQNDMEYSRRVAITELTSLPVPTDILARISADTNPYSPWPLFKDTQNKKQCGVVMRWDQPGASFYGPNLDILAFWQGKWMVSNTDVVTLDGTLLFWPEEYPGTVYDNKKVLSLLGLFNGKTVKQAWDQYAMVPGGRLLPDDSTLLPGHMAYYSPSGTAPVDLPAMQVTKSVGMYGGYYFQQTNNPLNYVVKVKNSSGTFVYSDPVNLTSKWTVVPVISDGIKRGVLVRYTDATVPAIPNW